MNKSVLTGIVLGVFAFSAPLHAATLTLIPQSSTVEVGGTITLDLYMDATDVTVGGTPVMISGSVIVTVEDALADFTGFTFASPPDPGSPALQTGVLNEGGIDMEYVAYGFVGATNDAPIVIGTYTFTAIGSVGDVIGFTGADANPFGSFYNSNPASVPATQFEPVFQDASIQVVPIPAAAWLFGCGLLGLVALRRKKRLLA
jgi:hypothetical protein